MYLKSFKKVDDMNELDEGIALHAWQFKAH